MGKTSKKMKRQAQKNADNRKLQQCQPQEVALTAAFEDEEYAKVLEILAELIQAGDIKPDLLYKGAYSYFMLGDYERAAQWVNNTLNYAPNHVDARILLARLCFIQDRHEDGLSLYEFLVKHFGNIMTKEQKDQIIDSSAYYVHREPENLRQNYPQLAELLQLDKSPVDVIQSVTAEPAAAEGSALSALQRLKAKLQAVQAKNDQANAPVEKADTDVAGQIAEIQSRSCSFREKVRLFNSFAGAQYVAEDYKGAAAYLKAALQLDDKDEQSIRNMAMVQAALGEYDKAQALVTRLAEVDFVLLYLLREQSNG